MKLSQLVTKTRKEISGQDVSINAQLLERAGYISKLMSGVYSFLPLGLKVLTNIENIVRDEMNKLGAQELLMPALQPKENWEITGRWDKVDVLFKLKGSGDKDFALGATHEEVVTPLIGSYIQSYKDLPVSVYQIQTKFRNEPRSKSGLLRGREFRMKDLYSFHKNQENLDTFYEKSKVAYSNIFKRLGLGDITYLTYASGGTFSKYSHEFQTVTPFGEDIIYLCHNCSIAINKELIEEMPFCPACKIQRDKLEEKKAIEVGNIFKLGTKFSKDFNLSYLNEFGKKQEIFMGCYGIGTSRLMGSVVEILHDKNGIIWPEEIAPYKVHLIAFGKEDYIKQEADKLYNLLKRNSIEVLYDDRSTASSKFVDADLIGLPWRVIVSSKTLKQDNKVELKSRTSDQVEYLSQQELISRFKL